MPDLREVKQLVASGYEWICDDCGEMNEEDVIPSTPDLTCQYCGCNYKNGGGVHIHAKDSVKYDKCPNCLRNYFDPKLKFCVDCDYDANNDPNNPDNFSDPDPIQEYSTEDETWVDVDWDNL
jgi:hypothetical protein